MLDSSLPLPRPCRATGTARCVRLLVLVAHAVIHMLLSTRSRKDRYIESGQERLERLPHAGGSLDRLVDDATQALAVKHRLPPMPVANVEMGI